jgi:hypothetical protein
VANDGICACDGVRTLESANKRCIAVVLYDTGIQTEIEQKDIAFENLKEQKCA